MVIIDFSSSLLMASFPEHKVGDRQDGNRSSLSPVNPILEAWLQSEEPHQSFAAGFGSRRGNILEKIDPLLKDLDCVIL